MKAHNKVDAGQVCILELSLAYLIEAAAMTDPLWPAEVARAGNVTAARLGNIGRD
jgi:hypothetical protein|tara:strand:- start:3525 stop:3689 length:165 start_codon:yes stop_codon:yes gene_type:complete